MSYINKLALPYFHHFITFHYVWYAWYLTKTIILHKANREMWVINFTSAALYIGPYITEIENWKFKQLCKIIHASCNRLVHPRVSHCHDSSNITFWHLQNPRFKKKQKNSSVRLDVAHSGLQHIFFWNLYHTHSDSQWNSNESFMWSVH